MQRAYFDAMKKKPAMQFRLPLSDKRGADLAVKLQKVAEVNGLSVNDVCNMAMAAGLPMVETKLREIHQPVLEAA
jgi:hypothetical protein